MPGSSAGSAEGTVYVLLPVHNRRAVTERFVRGLLEQTCRDVHLVLIDDGSSDGTADAVTALLPGTTVIRGTGSWWWAGSLQQGYRWLARRGPSERDVVLIANDDTRFDPEFLELGRSAVRRGGRSLLLAQRYAQDTGLLKEVGVHVSWKRLKFKGVKDPSRVNCMSTRGLFLPARDFVDLGGLRPRLLPHYLSDYELTIRAARNGFELRSDPAVRLWDTLPDVRPRPARSAAGFLRRTLSRRSRSNPVDMTVFLLLTCPRRHLARNLLHVWKRFLIQLMVARRATPVPPRSS